MFIFLLQSLAPSIIIKKEKGVLSQCDIDTMWAHTYDSFHSGVVTALAPKVKPVSTAGPASSDDDTPLAISSTCVRSSKLTSKTDARSL